MIESALFFIASALWALNAKQEERSFRDDVMSVLMAIIAVVLLWRGHP